MTKLNSLEIRQLEVGSKVKVVKGKEIKNVEVYRIIDNSRIDCTMIKEDVLKKIISNPKEIFNKSNFEDVLTYCFYRDNEIQVFNYKESLVSVKNNLCNQITETVMVGLEDTNLKAFEKKQLNLLIDDITMHILNVVMKEKNKKNKSKLSFSVTGVLGVLSIVYDLDNDSYEMDVEKSNKEKEVTYSKAIESLPKNDVLFRLESAVMDDLIERAIEYEDNISMEEGSFATAEEFLNQFIKEDYSSVFDIMKFITFYGTKEDMQEIIRTGRWFSENKANNKIDYFMMDTLIAVRSA